MKKTVKSKDAQIERLAAVLRDVERSGGKDCWSHLHSHGHKYSTVRSAVVRGYLRQPHLFHYEWTDDAAEFLMKMKKQEPAQ